jgi:hypothetical protein
MCYIQFPQQVNSKSITKVRFMTGVDRDMLGGALLYRLPQKEDIFTNTQLLVIWGYKPDMSYSRILYSHALLIEHESTLVWDKDKLKMLYDAYDNQWYTDYDLGAWLLNDDTKLNLEYRSLYGGFEVEIFISEEKRLISYRKPLWVDPSR